MNSNLTSNNNHQSSHDIDNNSVSGQNTENLVGFNTPNQQLTGNNSNVCVANSDQPNENRDEQSRLGEHFAYTVSTTQNQSSNICINFNIPRNALPEFDLSQLLHVLSLVFESEITVNTRIRPELSLVPSSDNLLSIFYSCAPVDISIEDYLYRIVNYSKFEESVYIHALVYLFRLKALHEALALCSLNLHRLWITSLVLAAKIVQDETFPMSYYAKIGGIPTLNEFNRLELAFLQFLDHNLFVSNSEYANTVDFLKDKLRYAQRNQGGDQDMSSEITFYVRR